MTDVGNPHLGENDHVAVDDNGNNDTMDDEIELPTQQAEVEITFKDDLFSTDDSDNCFSRMMR